MAARYLAIDIGASSGRHIIGEVVAGKLELTEVYRFENKLVERDGHLCWDIDRLYREVVVGLKACAARDLVPDTLGIDTWAVDYVLLDEAGRRIGDAVAYRDRRTVGVRDELERAGVLGFAEHYARTGIQYQQFNTAYQLVALKHEHPEQLERARTLLMVPDYLHYLLTGVAACEYTNASTTALVDARARDWDDELIARLGLPREIFLPLRQPGEELGHLSPEVRDEVGFDCRVVLPATHDTGSAWLAVPAADKHAVYLSSGTWSLLGCERTEPIVSAASAEANFTNEGGAFGTVRYLKNIMGLWMAQCVRRELADPDGTRPSFGALADAAAAAEGFSSLVDVDDDRFLAPTSMTDEVRAACAESGQAVPQTTGELMRCIYRSLAADYARAIEGLSRLTGTRYTAINIVGGGCQNAYLNQETADACGLPVYAGPVEGTALGNLMVQLIAAGEVADLAAARALVRNSFGIEKIEPRR